MHRREKIDCRSLLAHRVRAIVRQQGMELPQRAMEPDVATDPRRKALEIVIAIEAEIVLQRAQPAHVDIQHPIRPRRIVERIAGMHLFGIHQHHGTGAHR